MPNSLDISGLNGLTVTPQEFGFVGSRLKPASGAYTVATSAILDVNGQYGPFSGPVSTKAPLKLNVFHFAPNQVVTSPAFNFLVGFSSSKPFSFSGDTAAVVGWNANSILLEGNRHAISSAQYLIISSTDLKHGSPEPANLVFTTTGPAPTIDGFTPPIVPAVCFAAGTHIATAFGLARVEHVRMGDLVRTVSGALRPVIWAGKRRIDAASHPQPASVMPVCIAAHAFGPGLPVRPLTLSPEHAVFAGGAMVPVRHLVNGTTIRQVAVAYVTYHHIELQQHDALLAEGLPAESYRDTGNRTALDHRVAGAA